VNWALFDQRQAVLVDSIDDRVLKLILTGNKL
jgi:hypothetical protein